MLHDKSIINAGFSGLNNARSTLLDVKKACQQALNTLNNELNKKRTHLAARLRQKKKTAFILGYRAGLKSASEETSACLNQAKALYAESLQRADTDCLELAINVAKEILQTEIISNTDSLAKRVSVGIEKLYNSDNLHIKVHEIHVPEMKEIFKKYPNKVEISSDTTLEPGNAIIETECGQVNLNWKTQLEMIHQVLLSKIANQTNSERSSHAAVF